MAKPRSDDKRHEVAQPFTDESRSVDEERGSKENDRIRDDEATQQDETAANVDKAHRLAR